MLSVDWSKDRLIVQRVKHGRIFASAESGCEPADTDEQRSLSPARSEIAKPMRVSAKASPAVRVSEELRKLIAKGQTAADEMDKQKETVNAKIMEEVRLMEEKLAAAKEKRQPVVADRGRSSKDAAANAAAGRAVAAASDHGHGSKDAKKSPAAAGRGRNIKDAGAG